MNEMEVRVAWAIERAADDFSGEVVVGRQFQKEPHPESLAMARAAIKAIWSYMGEEAIAAPDSAQRS